MEIIGSSGVALAWGLHYYLKNYCNVHVSWEGSQIELPPTLPDVRVKVTSNDRYRILIKRKRWNEIVNGCFTDLGIIRTCALLVIPPHGGNGNIGKETSTGWPLMESIWLLLLTGKRLSGREYTSNWISLQTRLMNTLAGQRFYLGNLSSYSSLQ